MTSVTSVDEKDERVEGACELDRVWLGYPQISQMATDDLVGRRGGSFSHL